MTRAAPPPLERRFLPALRGEGEWPRKEFIYWTDDGSVAALRYNNWKLSFLRQDATGLRVWSEPFVELRMPLVENLRMDPFERAADEGMGYQHVAERMYTFAPAECRAVAAELPRVPTAPEAGQLQPRPRDGGRDQAPGRYQVVTPRPSPAGGAAIARFAELP